VAMGIKSHRMMTHAPELKLVGSSIMVGDDVVVKCTNEIDAKNIFMEMIVDKKKKGTDNNIN